MWKQDLYCSLRKSLGINDKYIKILNILGYALLPLHLLNWLMPVVVIYFLFQNLFTGIMLIIFIFVFPFTYCWLQFPNLIFDTIFIWVLKKNEGNKKAENIISFITVSTTFIWQIILGLFILYQCDEVFSILDETKTMWYKICVVYTGYYMTTIGVSYLISKEKNAPESLFAFLGFYKLGFFIVTILNYFYDFSLYIQFAILIFIIYFPMIFILKEENKYLKQFEQFQNG